MNAIEGTQYTTHKCTCGDVHFPADTPSSVRNANIQYLMARDRAALALYNFEHRDEHESSWDRVNLQTVLGYRARAGVVLSSYLEEAARNPGMRWVVSVEIWNDEQNDGPLNLANYFRADSENPDDAIIGAIDWLKTNE